MDEIHACNLYREAISKAYIDPIRTVIAVDDEFPTMDALLSTAPGEQGYCWKGMPENARRLKQLFVDHDGFFIASPEYNSSFSPLLKNSLDWISRVGEENEPSLMAYTGKVAALSATSPGGLGGLRGLVSLRMMLGNLGVTVIPKQVAIGSGFQAFNDDSELVDEAQARMLENVIDALINAADRMSG